MLDLSKISDNGVTFPLFKEGTVANDYLESLFVSHICELGQACRWEDLDSFIQSDRTGCPQQNRNETYREMRQFLSPNAKKSQDDIERINDGDCGSVGDFGLHGDHFSHTREDDIGSAKQAINYESANSDEEYGNINRDELRKSMIDQIDSILNSGKYPDRYVEELSSKVRNFVNEAVVRRNKEISTETKTQHFVQYDFPGDECRHDEPAAKRKKNVLG